MQKDKQHGVPVAGCDYFYLGDDDETGLPFLAVKDEETGEISLVNPVDSMNESLDYRSLTRSFLSRFL